MSVQFEKPDAVQVTTCGGRTPYWTKNKIISLALVLIIISKLAIIYVVYMVYYGIPFCDSSAATPTDFADVSTNSSSFLNATFPLTNETISTDDHRNESSTPNSTSHLTSATPHITFHLPTATPNSTSHLTSANPTNHDRNEGVQDSSQRIAGGDFANTETGIDPTSNETIYDSRENLSGSMEIWENSTYGDYETNQPEGSVSEGSTLEQGLKYRCGRRMIENLNFTEGPDTNTYFGQFPWMLVLLKFDAKGRARYKCGASLIGPNVALTAAHCVQYEGDYLVQAGEWNLGGDTEEELLPKESRDVIDFHIHANYSLDSYENDIALLRLGEDMEYDDHIRPICLPDWSLQYDRENCVLTGWGKDGLGSQYTYHLHLRQLGLSLLQRDACSRKLQETRLGKYYELSYGNLCAWNTSADINSCKGDGGSPLICPVRGDPDLYVQVGVALWSIDCDPMFPDIYSDVEYYRDWIDDKLAMWSNPDNNWKDGVEK